MTEGDSKYKSLKDPPHYPGEDVSVSHLFILAWDENEERYAFGTNIHMLVDKNDAERFKTCDLSRYPVGAKEGFNNKIVVIQTLYKGEPKRMGVDNALRNFDSGQGFKEL